jgi:acyl carrier protein
MTMETTQYQTDLRAEIRDVILELAPDSTRAHMDDPRLIEDLNYHSLALLELAFALEDRYNLPPIEREAAQTLTTMGAVVDFVIEHNGAAQ